MHIFPVGNTRFLKSFESCTGVITGAGFEMCAEAMYLRKKLIVVPIKNQYEQLCNAAALKVLGIYVLQKLEGHEHKIREWLEAGRRVSLASVAEPAKLVYNILETQAW